MSISIITKDKKFAPLFWTQFFGALNDNLLKNALVVLVTYKGVQLWGMDSASFVAFLSGIFILPFFLFSPLAGQLSDKFEKSQLILMTKYWELMIVVIAGIGFYFHVYSLLAICLFLLGTQSAFFGPMKYSILPEILPEERLVQGNAYVELGTFIAILLGTIGGGVATTLPSAEIYVILGLVIFAVFGVLAAKKIPVQTPGHPTLRITLNPFSEMKDMWKISRKSKAVFNSVLGISWFWLFGAGILSLLPSFCKDVLAVNESVVTAFLAMFTIGIGIGSVICEKLSFQRVELGLVPIGSLGMTLFLVDLFLITPEWVVTKGQLIGLTEFLRYQSGWRLMVDFFMMSLFGGFFIVPLYTVIQQRSEKQSRSRVIAANNILNAIFMVISSVLIMVFHSQKWSLQEIFAFLAISNIVVSVYIYTIVPEFTLRFWAWVLAHCLYRLKVYNSHRIPKEGPAILICNHVTYVDWLIIAAGSSRPIRFIMYYKFFKIPVIKYLMKNAKVIPIAGANENKEIYDKAFDKISEALREGDLLCIFPEGKVTRDGQLSEFKKGIEHIVKRDPVPVVPMILKNMWGSLFSFSGGKILFKKENRFWKKVELHIGEPIPSSQVYAKKLQEQIQLMLDKST